MSLPKKCADVRRVSENIEDIDLVSVSLTAWPPLHHLTIDTGHVAFVPVTDTEIHTVESCREAIRHARESGRDVEIAPDYVMWMGRHGPVVLRVYRRKPPGYVLRIGHEGLVSCLQRKLRRGCVLRIGHEGPGFARYAISVSKETRARCAAYWSDVGMLEIRRLFGIAPDIETRPPGCVGWLEGVELADNLAEWLDNVQRCVSWALIEEAVEKKPS